MEQTITLPLADAKALWRFMAGLALDELIPADKGNTLAALLKPFSDAIAEKPVEKPQDKPSSSRRITNGRTFVNLPNQPPPATPSPSLPSPAALPDFVKSLKKNEVKIFPYDGKLHVFADVVDMNKKIREMTNKSFTVEQRERIGTSNIIHALLIPPPHLEPTIRAMEKELEKQNVATEHVTSTHS